MARLLGLLLVCAGFALAQEEEDEGGISVDGAPSGPEEEEAKPAQERTTAFPAREPGKKVATVTIRKKAYSFAVPADWVLFEEENEKAELAFEVLLPGSEKRALLELGREERVDPRSSPYYLAEWFKKEKPETRTEVRTNPCPRLVARQKLNETDWVDVYFYLSIKNNQFRFHLSCSATDFQEAETDMFATVRTFTAEVELSPEIPKGYETSQEGIWLIARAPGVTASTAPLVKALKDVERRFRREHGPLPKNDAPLVVLVHASRAQGAKLEPKIAEQTTDFSALSWSRRLFAIPFAKGNLEQEGLLAASACELLVVAKYGDDRPDWIFWGEALLARAETMTGKPLPSLHEGFVAWASTLKLHKPGDLDELRKSDSEAWTRECLFYAAALREGKYKKQYKAFLDDVAETADGLGAFERHLGSIDEDDLVASTNQYISTRIKEEKRAK
jgi:hypothetical protein